MTTGVSHLLFVPSRFKYVIFIFICNSENMKRRRVSESCQFDACSILNIVIIVRSKTIGRVSLTHRRPLPKSTLVKWFSLNANVLLLCYFISINVDQFKANNNPKLKHTNKQPKRIQYLDLNVYCQNISEVSRILR
jgi:hypothetical protein